MIILDENIREDQRQLLRGWRIHIRQIGVDLGRKGLDDEAIIRLLHQPPRSTFITRDLGFFQRHLVHPGYGLVCLEVNQSEAASFVRRFLRHPRFSTQRKRDGSVVRVSHRGLSRLALRGPDELVPW